MFSTSCQVTRPDISHFPRLSLTQSVVFSWDHTHQVCLALELQCSLAPQLPCPSNNLSTNKSCSTCYHSLLLLASVSVNTSVMFRYHFIRCETAPQWILWLAHLNLAQVINTLPLIFGVRQSMHLTDSDLSTFDLLLSQSCMLEHA